MPWETSRLERDVSAMAAVAVELVTVEPNRLRPRSVTRTKPLVVIVNDDDVAPATSFHDEPLDEVCHCSDVEVAPFHVPVVAVSDEPMQAFPLTLGGAELVGGAAPGIRQLPALVEPFCTPPT